GRQGAGRRWKTDADVVAAGVGGGQCGWGGRRPEGTERQVLAESRQRQKRKAEAEAEAESVRVEESARSANLGISGDGGRQGVEVEAEGGEAVAEGREQREGKTGPERWGSTEVGIGQGAAAEVEGGGGRGRRGG
ncbi:hypothetical protein CYMTET_21016, partial [Cymbomonas tetramitiformis]